MARKKKSTAPDGLSEKVWNKLSETWRAAAQSKQTEELEQEVIKAVRSMAESSHDMKNDEKLAALMEDIKLIKGAYTDAIAAEKAKIDFCVFLFNTRGMPASDDKDEEEVA